MLIPGKFCKQTIKDQFFTVKSEMLYW